MSKAASKGHPSPGHGGGHGPSGGGSHPSPGGAKGGNAAHKAKPHAHHGGNTGDLDRQIEQLKRCEIIKEAEVKALCAKAREILVEESNVQRVDSPVTVRNLSLSPK